MTAIKNNDLEKTFEIIDKLSLNSIQTNTFNKFRMEFIHGNVSIDFIQRLILCVKGFYKEE